MAYADKIAVTNLDTMAEIYRITVGTSVYRYTTYETSLTVFSETFEPAPIKRTAYSIDKDLKVVQMTLSAPLSAEILAYIANTPAEPTNIEVWRVFVSEVTSYRKIFAGYIRQVKFQNKIASVNCEGRSGKLRGKLPQFLFQSFCNYSLFDESCSLNSADYRETATVTVSGSTLVSATFATHADGYYNDGKVMVDTDMRLITSHTTNTITLQFPFDTRLVTGGSVDIWPGCTKSPAACKDKFNNIVRFGGFPYIPNKNPTLVGIF